MATASALIWRATFALCLGLNHAQSLGVEKFSDVRLDEFFFEG
jgi:hypothetical protein